MLPRYTECLAAVTLQLEKSSLFFIPPFLLSAFNSSFMGAEESSYHRAAPRAKNEIGRGGERGRQEVGGGGLECLCDTEREKQTDKEEERRLCVRFTS